MEKSYVTIEAKVCVVCGHQVETGNLLIDKRMREAFDPITITGFDICQQCNDLHRDGYCAIVAIDPAKSKASEDGNILPHNAYRTGLIAHVRRSVWEALFTIPVCVGPFMFADTEVVQRIINRASTKG